MLDKFEVLRKAETYVVNRQFGRAISEYRSLLESKGEDPAILNTLGDLLLKNKQQAEALERAKGYQVRFDDHDWSLNGREDTP